MDLPVVVRSAHTWDTRAGRDLRKDEEAIVVSVAYRGNDTWRWQLIPLDSPRLITLNLYKAPSFVVQRWLKPTW